jgi:hypothetical protein
MRRENATMPNAGQCTYACGVNLPSRLSQLLRISRQVSPYLLIRITASHLRTCCGGVGEWLEVDMPMSRRAAHGGRAFAIPLFGVMVLLASYWLLADWQNVPTRISSAFATMHWPI